MKGATPLIPSRRATLLRLSANIAFVLALGAACFGQHYVQVNLASNTAGAARITGPQFINPWGISRSTSSTWIVARGNGFSTVHNGADAKQSLVVAGTPTGTIFNSSRTAFLLGPGKPAIFLFSTLDGTIVAWNPNLAVDHGAASPSKHGVTVVKTGDGSSYTGLTSALIDGKPYLYAANFTKHRVDVYDSTFHPVRQSPEHSGADCTHDQACFAESSFLDERLPWPYAPFNVQAIGNNIVVTYAIHQEVSPLETDGPGLGFVDIFDPTGHLLLRLDHGDWLNAPWGVALAPADFGRFSDNLLIGQFGGGGDTQSSGCIAAFDLITGKFMGLLRDVNGKPLVIKGIWALSRNVSPNKRDSSAGSSAQVYFTAEPDHGSGAVFGYLSPISMEDRIETVLGWPPKSRSDIHARITSTPPGADIQIDGTYVGITPLDIDLSCCFHDVTISKPGRRPWTGKVRNNGHAEIHAQLPK